MAVRKCVFCLCVFCRSLQPEKKAKKQKKKKFRRCFADFTGGEHPQGAAGSSAGGRTAAAQRFTQRQNFAFQNGLSPV